MGGNILKESKNSEALILGISICIGLIFLGYFISAAIVEFKKQDRTVVVKGLAEREVPADLAIWPIRFNVADNDLNMLFQKIETQNALVVEFLKKNGFSGKEISISAPSIVDKQAQSYSSSGRIRFRYSGRSTITVYTKKVDVVRNTMKKLVELGRRGVVIGGEGYETRTEFLFTRLNEIKPAMIEEATKKAREVALKFAKDSNSRLGKIKRARQGLFSITNRDNNTPFIKKVRVVSTLEYYLID